MGGSARAPTSYPGQSETGGESRDGMASFAEGVQQWLIRRGWALPESDIAPRRKTSIPTVTKGGRDGCHE